MPPFLTTQHAFMHLQTQATISTHIPQFPPVVRGSRFQLPLLKRYPATTSTYLGADSGPYISGDFQTSPSIGFARARSISSTLVIQFGVIRRRVSVVIAGNSTADKTGEKDNSSGRRSRRRKRRRAIRRDRHRNNHHDRNTHQLQFVRLIRFVRRFNGRLQRRGRWIHT